MSRSYGIPQAMLSLLIEKSLLDQIDTFARRNERSRASMVRMILREWTINEAKKQKKSIYELEQEEAERKAAAEERKRQREREGRPRSITDHLEEEIEQEGKTQGES